MLTATMMISGQTVIVPSMVYKIRDYIELFDQFNCTLRLQQHKTNPEADAELRFAIE